MKLQKRGISRVVTVVVLVVIVAIAVAAYYLSSAPSSGGTATTTQSTTSTSTAVSTTGTSSSAVPSSSSSTLSSASTTTSSTSAGPSSSSTSASTTPTTTPQTSTQTLTAKCTSTTTASPASTVLALVPQLDAYPSMTMVFSGTTSTMKSGLNFTFSYSVQSVTSTTYRVAGDFAGNPSVTFTAWLLKNGTTLAVNLNHSSSNMTGTMAANLVQGYFGELAAVQGFVQEQSIYSNLFRSNGTSTVTIGTNTFTVTNYTAYALPETIQLCTGETDSLTAYSLSEGTPSGSSYELPVYVSIAGSSTSNGSATPFAFTIRITAFTVG